MNTIQPILIIRTVFRGGIDKNESNISTFLKNGLLGFLEGYGCLERLMSELLGSPPKLVRRESRTKATIASEAFWQFSIMFDDFRFLVTNLPHSLCSLCKQLLITSNKGIQRKNCGRTNYSSKIEKYRKLPPIPTWVSKVTPKGQAHQFWWQSERSQHRSLHTAHLGWETWGWTHLLRVGNVFSVSRLCGRALLHTTTSLMAPYGNASKCWVKHDLSF